LLLHLICKWVLRQIDINSAYLNANQDDKIFVQIPIGEKNFNWGKSRLLQKVINGLRQAGRQCFFFLPNLWFS